MFIRKEPEHMKKILNRAKWFILMKTNAVRRRAMLISLPHIGVKNEKAFLLLKREQPSIVDYSAA